METENLQNTKVLDKLTKINELINRGATNGEKSAAKAAFAKLIEKYNISDEELKTFLPSDYVFKFSNRAEETLLYHISAYVLDIWTKQLKLGWNGVQRNVTIKNLTKLQFIEITAMYEYFRRHMKSEYKKVVSDAVSEAKRLEWSGYRIGPKQKPIRVSKERWKAQTLFISKYLKISGIARWDPASETTSISSITDTSLLNTIEGGQYFQQINTDSRLLD